MFGSRALILNFKWCRIQYFEDWAKQNLPTFISLHVVFYQMKLNLVNRERMIRLNWRIKLLIIQLTFLLWENLHVDQKFSTERWGIPHTHTHILKKILRFQMGTGTTVWQIQNGWNINLSTNYISTIHDSDNLKNEETF